MRAAPACARRVRSTMSSAICWGPNSWRCLSSSSAGRSNGVPNSSLFVYVPSIRGSPHEVRGTFGALELVCADSPAATAAPSVTKASPARDRAFICFSSALLLISGFAVVRLAPALRAYVDFLLRVRLFEHDGIVDRPRDLELARFVVDLEPLGQLQFGRMHDAVARLERRGDEARRLDDERSAVEASHRIAHGATRRARRRRGSI